MQTRCRRADQEQQVSFGHHKLESCGKAMHNAKAILPPRRGVLQKRSNSKSIKATRSSCMPSQAVAEAQRDLSLIVPRPHVMIVSLGPFHEDTDQVPSSDRCCNIRIRHAKHHYVAPRRQYHEVGVLHRRSGSLWQIRYSLAYLRGPRGHVPAHQHQRS